MRTPGTRAAALAAAAAALLASQACSSRPAARSGSSPAPPVPAPSAATPPGGAPSPERASSTEVPVSAERNPPGDIPDSVRFVEYASPTGGYSLKAPEGWARTESGSSVAFADKLDAIHVEVQPASAAPTPESVRTDEEPRLAAGVRAFKELKVVPATLPAGAGVLLRYQANSDPEPVTGKQVRLEVDRYEVFKGGRLLIVALSAPAGSDNVDVWHLVSQSVRWTP